MRDKLLELRKLHTVANGLADDAQNDKVFDINIRLFERTLRNERVEIESNSICIYVTIYTRKTHNSFSLPRLDVFSLRDIHTHLQGIPYEHALKRIRKIQDGKYVEKRDDEEHREK